MIPILNCGYGKFKCLLKLIKKNNDNDDDQYKGNYRRKAKREEKERDEIRESFIKPD